MFTQDRDTMRSFFVEAWRKARDGVPLEPLEAQIAAVVRAHPEYHHLLDNADAVLSKDFLPEDGETNPFLHLSMHLAILEQVATDRPRGIRAAYQKNASAMGDAHAAEHRIMECLGQALWEAQRSGGRPNESAYLECLHRLVPAADGAR
jgi:hypothetical protein